MNKRSRFIDYVKLGEDYMCSPQIGAGAGFDTKMSGKKWISETTLEDTISTVEKFDIVPLINVGLCDLGCCNPDIVWEEKPEIRTENRITREKFLSTPVGKLHVKSVEEINNAPLNIVYPVTGEDDLDAFEYYIDAAMNSDFSFVTAFVNDISCRIGGRAALSVQWPLQPYELLCFPNTVDNILLLHDCPERFKRLMEKIVKLDIKLLEATAKGGADFVFLGAPGSEMLSPAHYENYIVPYSKIVTSEAHSLGLMIYSHICSPVEPMLTKGYYNEMNIDLFETLSPPPVGNIISFQDALSKIDPRICTRGNLGLDTLLERQPAEIKEEAFKILEGAKGRKHILAASDYLFYQIPEENVNAMCEAVKEYRTTSLNAD